jgi:16S rRNA processing protein RimM
MSEGAETSSSEQLVPLGEIVGTHGVGGLLRFRSYSAPADALGAPRTVSLQPKTARVEPRRKAPMPAPAASPPADGRPPRSARLLSARPHGRVVLLQFDGVTTIEAATPFVGTVLSIPEGELPAPEPGEFYAYQLEGLEVVTRDGGHIGTVDHLFPTGSNEVLVVRDGPREYLIPVIEDVVRTIDFAGRKVVIDPIEGLLD